jgi:hypothetical protein
MRFLRLGVAVGSLSALSFAIACGIDDGGLIEEPVESGVQDQVVPTDTLQGDTNPPKDVVQPDTSPPPSCADAGACLSEFDGSWTPYLRIVGNGACPAADGSVRADYSNMDKVTFDPSACVCGNCATDAGCTDPVVTLGANNKCNDLFDGGKAPLDGSCADFGYNISGGSLSISASNQTAFAVCSVSQTGNQAWDAAVESVCSTSCDFDFCSAPKGAYERCALAQGVHACPNGYKQYLLDRPNTPANCSACTCTPGRPAAARSRCTTASTAPLPPPPRAPTPAAWTRAAPTCARRASTRASRRRANRASPPPHCRRRTAS